MVEMKKAVKLEMFGGTNKTRKDELTCRSIEEIFFPPYRAAVAADMLFSDLDDINIMTSLLFRFIGTIRIMMEAKCDLPPTYEFFISNCEIK